MKKNFSKISKNIHTKQELVYLLDDIAQAKKAIYKGEQELLSKKLKNVVGKKLRRILKEQEEENNLQTRKQQEEFLNNLKDYLQNIPQIKLTIAFSPSDSFLKEITQWLENQVGKEVIINLTIKPDIVGGAIIEYNGHYLNLALKDQIEELTHE